MIQTAYNLISTPNMCASLSSLLYDGLYDSEDDLIYWIWLNVGPEPNFTPTVYVCGRCKYSWSLYGSASALSAQC